MPQREEIILTKIDKTESFSVFLAYNNCISYVYDIHLDKNISAKEKYERYSELEKALISVQEYVTKAEKYLQKLSEYNDSPEKFVDLSHYPQISYTNIDALSDGFLSFIEDLYKAYDNFFKHLIDKITPYDPGKNYKAYMENKPNGHKDTPEIAKKKTDFIGLLSDINKDAFSKNFDNLTKIYFDLNEKRNAINHHGKTKSDLMTGHYTVSVDPETLKPKVRTFPSVQYYEKNHNILEYSNYIFGEIFQSMQHIFAACINTLIDTKTSISGLGKPYFYPVAFIEKTLKEGFDKRGQILSEAQLYIFGHLFEGMNLVSYQGSRPMDPDYLEKLKKLRGQK